jgi:hypothetical protein
MRLFKCENSESCEVKECPHKRLHLPFAIEENQDEPCNKLGWFCPSKRLVVICRSIVSYKGKLR